MKIGNQLKGNRSIMSQSPHGAYQGGKAIDIVPDSSSKDILAPGPGYVSSVYGVGGQRYFYFIFSGSYRVIDVHGKPTIQPGIYVKEGDKIGELVPYFDGQGRRADHLHTAIETPNGWDYYYSYMKRSISIALIPGFKSQHWKVWSTWADKQIPLPINNTTMQNTVTVQSGWGISHVAKAAGYTDYASESRWNYIASLNGYASYKLMHLSPGQVIKVRVSTSELPKVPSEIEKYKEEIQKLEQEHEKEKERLMTKIREQQDSNEKEIQELQERIQGLIAAQEELKKDEEEVIRLIDPSFQVEDLFADILNEEQKTGGLIEKWGQIIDSRIGNRILRSILKYDIFVMLGAGLAAAIAFIPSLGVNAYIATLLTTLAGIVIKLLIPVYDTNKDGSLTIDDTLILKDYQEEKES